VGLEITFIKASRSIQIQIQAPPGADHGATCSKGSKDIIWCRLHKTEALERWATQGALHPLGCRHCTSGGGAWEAASSGHSSPAPSPASQACWQAKTIACLGPENASEPSNGGRGRGKGRGGAEAMEVFLESEEATSEEDTDMQE